MGGGGAGEALCAFLKEFPPFFFTFMWLNAFQAPRHQLSKTLQQRPGGPALRWNVPHARVPGALWEIRWSHLAIPQWCSAAEVVSVSSLNVKAQAVEHRGCWWFQRRPSTCLSDAIPISAAIRYRAEDNLSFCLWPPFHAPTLKHTIDPHPKQQSGRFTCPELDWLPLGYQPSIHYPA